jgi:exopolysaccharide biosynthesis protein
MSHRDVPTGLPLRWRAGRGTAFVCGFAVGILGVGGGGWAVQRFVLAPDEAAAAGDSGRACPTAASSAVAGPAGGETKPVIGDTSYTNGKTSIKISKRETGHGDSKVTSYLADIMMADATALRSAFSKGKYGKLILEVPSDTAKSVGAVLAFNGDFYGFRDNGIIIRNGTIYRDEGVRPGLAMYRNGTMAVYDETSTSAEQLLADGVWNTLSFGPELVRDGKVLSDIGTFEIGDVLRNGQKPSIQGRHPRTGIGMIGPGHFVVIVVDGRDPGYSRGVTMFEFARMFVDAGAKAAYNLDGGGSATMIFDGTVVNQPRNGSNVQKERPGSEILYIAK